MKILLLGVPIFALVLAACPRPADEPEEVDHALIVVSPQVTLRTDPVGESDTAATFALVDADNHGDRELLVRLAGDLVDAHGAVVGHLRPDELRIPPGGRRTFALVDDAVTARPDATGAKIAVASATIPAGRAPMRITDGHVYTDQGRAIAAAYVVNDSDLTGKAIVIAGFHDAKGFPMTRPWSIVQLGPGAKETAQFVGPPGSTTAYIYVGETSY